MFEFIVGYVLGFEASKARGLSGRALAIIALFFTVISATGYLMIQDLFPDFVPNSISECVGRPFEQMMCSFMSLAPVICVLLFVVAVLIALAVFRSNKE